MSKADFLGSWRIAQMEVWEPEDLDLDGPASIKFTKDGLGELGFLAIHGELDCRYGERDGRPLVEFTWDGQDEGDPKSGRGWAVLEQNGQLIGRIFIHLGDDSSFVASRQKEKSSTRPRRTR